MTYTTGDDLRTSFCDSDPGYSLVMSAADDLDAMSKRIIDLEARLLEKRSEELRDADIINSMSRRIIDLDEKWRFYENNYILPVFKWAAEMGIDLPALVVAGGGNCVELFVRELRNRIKELESTQETLEAELDRR
jgi:hypothetical protein